jgi:hypothetical protein
MREGEALEHVALHEAIPRGGVTLPAWGLAGHQVEPDHHGSRKLVADLHAPPPGATADVQHQAGLIDRRQEVGPQRLAQRVVLDVEAVRLVRMPYRK